MTTTPCAIRRLELLLARTPDMECADDLRFLLADYTLVIANYKTVCLNNEDLTQKLAEARRLLDDARAQEPCAYMFVDDLERFLESETFAQAYSIPVGAPDRGHSVPLYAAAPVPAQPACQGKNCGSTDGLTHSDECYAEAAETFSGKTPAAVPEAVAKDAAAILVQALEEIAWQRPLGVRPSKSGEAMERAAIIALHKYNALLSAADTEVSP